MTTTAGNLLSFVLVITLAGLVDTTSVQALDWSWGPVLPQAQTAEGSVAIHQSIVIVGGTSWFGLGENPPRKVYANKVWRLAADGTKWQALVHYPLPIAYALVLADADTLWVIGGANETGLLSATYSLDLSERDPAWRTGPSLPVPRMGSKGGIADGVIYVAAGTEQREDQQSPATDVLCLDTRIPKDGWQHVAEIPGNCAEWRMGTVVGGNLYLFGGLVAADTSQDGVESGERTFHRAAPFIPQAESCRYDITSKQWEQLKPLPTPTGSGACAVPDEGHIIITGGMALAMEGSHQPDHRNRLYLTSECLVYDIEKDRYERLNPPMRLAVSDQGCVCLEKKLFVIGGEDSPWKSRTDLVQIGQLP